MPTDSLAGEASAANRLSLSPQSAPDDAHDIAVLGIEASVWRSRSRLGFQQAVAWEQRPTGSSATAPPGQFRLQPHACEMNCCWVWVNRHVC